MASTLTETCRATTLGHLPPSAPKSHDPVATTTANTVPTSQQSSASVEPDSRQQPRISAAQSNAAHHPTSSLSQQQPGLSSLAVAAISSNRLKLEPSQTRPAQFRAMNSSNMNNGGGNNFGAAPTPTSIGNAGQQNVIPTCQNCTTSTTPLWRRDEIGSVLCNACGLFLKLHGRPRPISLKTDVIKSRNRVKTSGPGAGQKKKSLFDNSNHHNNNLGDPQAQLNHGTSQQNALIQQRRASQRSQNGHSDGSNSPISRTGTPNMYGNHMSAFNGNDLVDHQFHSPSLNGMHMGRQASPGRSETSLNDMPQTFEQLIATNSSLKTRVSELEVINELFRGRVTQLEQDEANARRGEEMRRESERNLRLHLEESQRRENQLKRRLDDLERELTEIRSNDAMDELSHKKQRIDSNEHLDNMANIGSMENMHNLEQMGQMGQMGQSDQQLEQMGQNDNNDLLDPAIKDEDPLLVDVLGGAATPEM